MQILTLLTTLLPSILGLMGIAERAFSSVPKSGQQKKDLVMAAAQTIIGGVQSVSTGGQAATWQAIAAPISQIIDAASSIAFPLTGEQGNTVTNIVDLRASE